MTWYRRISRRFMCPKLLMSDYMVFLTLLIYSLNVILYFHLYDYLFSLL
jgi:hypothetical protein